MFAIQCVEFIAIQADPAKGVDHDHLEEWPEDLVLLRLGNKKLRIQPCMADPYGSPRGYLKDLLKGKKAALIVDKVIEKAKEKIGPWIDDHQTTAVGAAFLDGDEPDYMTVAILGEGCRQVARLWIAFKKKLS